MLSIAEYDAAERKALESVGYTQLAAISTKTFEDHGFPTRMTHPSQFVRYYDWFRGVALSQLEQGKIFRDTPIQTSYSLDEIQMLRKVSGGVGALGEKLCGRRYYVHFNHLGLLGLFRVVEAISMIEGKKPLSVFEVGPGCGYLGNFLGMLGHQYGAYDTTQGYYLWQSWLYDHFFGDEFTEFAGSAGADLVRRSRIFHLPWWLFLNLYKRCPLRADIVISNANLGEMSYVSLRYVLRVARLMLADSDIGLLLFGGIGAPNQNRLDGVLHELAEAGFRQVMDKNVYGYVLKDRASPKRSIEVLEHRIPIYDPSGLGKTFGPRDFVNVDGDEFPEEYYFNAFISDWPNVGGSRG